MSSPFVVLNQTYMARNLGLDPGAAAGALILAASLVVNIVATPLSILSFRVPNAGPGTLLQ